ncbi:MAG: hypothetical protein NZZ41_00630 [Candidatus Dojkabacteria bacterium]|nr:hypothetical protein [Candidatus Dojkabacteria bacterium]
MDKKNFEKKYVGKDSTLQQKIKQQQENYISQKSKRETLPKNNVSRESLLVENNENENDINEKLDNIMNAIKSNNFSVNQNFIQGNKNNKTENKFENFSNKNPLRNYFRRPGISIKLPTNYLYYEENDIELTPMNELEIYPMTISDELILKNPDSLSNGSALEKLLISCCPGIRNPRKILNPDFDAILLGIRYSTYGKNMDIDTTCPKCGKENSFSIDLYILLENMKYLDEKPYLYVEDNLKITLKPYSLVTTISITKFAFEQSKLLMILNNESTPDEKKSELIDSITEKMTNFQKEVVLESIESIELPDGSIVMEKEFIKEWIENCPSSYINVLDNKINELNTIGVDKDFDAECTGCGNKWKQKISYDPTSFFLKR